MCRYLRRGKSPPAAALRCVLPSLRGCESKKSSAESSGHNHTRKTCQPASPPQRPLCKLLIQRICLKCLQKLIYWQFCRYIFLLLNIFSTLFYENLRVFTYKIGKNSAFVGKPLNILKQKYLQNCSFIQFCRYFS